MQIHESVINNGIQRLQLDGRTFTLPELSRHVAASLNCPAPWPTNPENNDVKITFADRNAVVVRCQDGRVVLTLSIAQLSKSPRHVAQFPDPRVLQAGSPRAVGPTGARRRDSN